MDSNEPVVARRDGDIRPRDRPPEGRRPPKRERSETPERGGFRGTVTVHLRGTAPDAAHEQQRAVVGELRRLDRNDVIERLRVRRWERRVSVPSDGPDSEVVGLYDEFVDAVGAHALEPFFEQRPGIGRLDRTVVLPMICVTARRDGELVGLYPRYNDDEHESVSDALTRLRGGDVENL
ncbi:MAG: hypothetical protein PPP58_11325 [Natronomonas sp.]